MKGTKLLSLKPYNKEELLDTISKLASEYDKDGTGWNFNIFDNAFVLSSDYTIMIVIDASIGSNSNVEKRVNYRVWMEIELGKTATIKVTHNTDTI
jgi:hypothetical protein